MNPDDLDGGILDTMSDDELAALAGDDLAALDDGLADDTHADAPAAATAPTFEYRLPDDFGHQFEAAKGKESALWAKFDDGELSREELRRELDAARGEAQKLHDMRLKAELASDMQRQQMERTRDDAVHALFRRAAAPEGGGIDYAKDKARLAELDTFLKALAADDANEDKPLQWFLNEAHRRVLVLHGGRAPDSRPDPRLDPRAAPAPDRHGADDGGDFDDLLSLDGDAFEEALGEMARRQPQRFARFQSSTKL